MRFNLEDRCTLAQKTNHPAAGTVCAPLVARPTIPPPPPLPAARPEIRIRIELGQP